MKGDQYSSVYREMGWGNSKEKLNKLFKKEQFVQYNGRIVCPKCGERKKDNIIELRAEFYECRTCHYTEDLSMWETK